MKRHWWLTALENHLLWQCRLGRLPPDNFDKFHDEGSFLRMRVLWRKRMAVSRSSSTTSQMTRRRRELRPGGRIQVGHQQNLLPRNVLVMKPVDMQFSGVGVSNAWLPRATHINIEELITPRKV